VVKTAVDRVWRISSAAGYLGRTERLLGGDLRRYSVVLSPNNIAKPGEGIFEAVPSNKS
jgi:hypothetical protein